MMMIKRGDNMYVPHGDTYLRLGDVVNVFGTNPAIEDFQEKLA
jgi:Trk K+ transport system NAD-binding subunit